MTLERFRQIAGQLSDGIPLGVNLRGLPFWPKAELKCTLRYVDGRQAEETVSQITKTVEGRYLVFVTDSKVYGQPMFSICGYDKNASALHMWSIYGDVVVDSILNFDTNKKLYAQSASYGEGFNELTVGSYTEHSSSEKTLVYKSGTLFMVREVEGKSVDNAK